jgi:hypothetical protein
MSTDVDMEMDMNINIFFNAGGGHENKNLLLHHFKTMILIKVTTLLLGTILTLAPFVAI